MKRTFAAFLAMGVTGGAALAQDAGAGLNRVVTFGESLIVGPHFDLRKHGANLLAPTES